MSKDELLKAIDRLTSWADTKQLTLAPDKCTVCRSESTRWHTPHLDNSTVTNSTVTNKGPTYTIYGNTLSASVQVCMILVQYMTVN